MGVQKRWAAHVSRARKTDKRHPLLDSIRKYGGETFRLSVVSQQPDKASAQAAEQFYIDFLQPALNLSAGGEADGETGAQIFWASVRSDPEKMQEYISALSRGCKERHRLRPDLGAALMRAGAVWRERNKAAAYKLAYRGIRLARKANGHSLRDPRFTKCGRLWIPSKKVSAARKSYKGRRSLRAQWAEQDQTQRKASISAAQARLWAEQTPEKRAKSLAQLAEARKRIIHSEEVKERRREGIRRYWAAKRAEKQPTTS